jgi:hypothetical protein
MQLREWKSVTFSPLLLSNYLFPRLSAAPTIKKDHLDIKLLLHDGPINLIPWKSHGLLGPAHCVIPIETLSSIGPNDPSLFVPVRPPLLIPPFNQWASACNWNCDVALTWHVSMLPHLLKEFLAAKETSLKKELLFFFVSYYLLSLLMFYTRFNDTVYISLLNKLSFLLFLSFQLLK